MIYITQLIYVNRGQEDTFHEFEKLAIPIIAKYNGKLNLRIRLDENSIVESSIDHPYEIHLVEFNSEQDLDNFMNDGERKKFLHLKEKSIKTSILIKGTIL